MEVNKKYSCYELLKQGKYVESYEQADKEYKNSRSAMSLGERAIALMNLKKYKEALNDYFEFGRINNKNSDWEYIGAGVAYWLMDNYEEAIKTWKQGLGKAYTDAAGGIQIPCLMLFASAYINNDLLKTEAVKLIKNKWKTKQAQANFPGSIAGYLLGEINEQSLLDSLSSQPVLRNRQMCKAKFYIGVSCLLNGDKDGFLKYMQQSKMTQAFIEEEYYLSIGEIDKAEISKK
jgi:hypothetical protein